MPKIIKKKIKPIKKEEPELKEVVSKAKSFRQWKPLYRALAIALPVVLLIISSVYFYNKTARSRAEKFQYEGYKLYHSINLKQSMPDSVRYEQALENFKKSYDAKPSAISLYYMASAYEKLGRLDDAISRLEELNRKFPEDTELIPIVLYKTAMINLKKSNTTDALKYLDALYNLKGSAFKDLALAESAKILEATGKPDEAKKKLEILAKEFPESGFSLKALNSGDFKNTVAKP